MIVPDVNLLVYAYNASAPDHDAARQWLTGLFQEERTVMLPWVAVHGFVRIMTHPRVLVEPLHPSQALSAVREWLARPHVQMALPGPRHLDIFQELLEQAGVGGNLCTDAQLAALAIEHQCELHSNDSDFARFASLRWRNPLA